MEEKEWWKGIKSMKIESFQVKDRLPSISEREKQTKETKSSSSSSR